MRRSKWRLLGFFAAMLTTITPAHAEVRIGLAAPLAGPITPRRSVTGWAARRLRSQISMPGAASRSSCLPPHDYCYGEQAVDEAIARIKQILSE
jgi:hypothetical protein